MHTNDFGKLVLKRGQHLAVRNKGRSSVLLYHMGWFFAEVWYRDDENSVAIVHGSKDSRILEPSLEAVDLGELIK